MDKVLAKHLLRAAGIPTPDWVAFNSTAFRELGAADALEEIEARLGFPLVVKPAAQGSALGVRFAASREDVPEALVAAFSYDDRVLLERHVAGRELAVSLLDGEALPIVEVRAKEEDRFNYEARYEIGRTEYICPADAAGRGRGERRATSASRAYETLGCAGFARVDLMLDADGTPRCSRRTRSRASPTRACCRWPPMPPGSSSRTWWRGSSSSRSNGAGSRERT